MFITGKNIHKYGRYIALLAILNHTGACAVLVPAAAVTTGAVALDERSVGRIVDDNVIFAKIKSEVNKIGFNEAFTKITVNVKEGRVMLTGTVKHEQYVQEAVKIAWSVAGVKEVINEIKVSVASINNAKDVWIANQIRSKFLFRKHFDSVNYSTSVNNAVVYLFGIAQNQEELNAAIEMASSVKGVKKVVNHVLLKRDMRRAN